MRILVDTNILISAVLFPNSKPARALFRVASNHEMVLCDRNISELREVVNRKAPKYIQAAEELLTELSYELIPAVYNVYREMRDKKDQPILNGAILSDVDIILTGDKDFLSLDIERPQCMTAADFLATEGVE